VSAIAFRVVNSSRGAPVSTDERIERGDWRRRANVARSNELFNRRSDR
jgi:hypothetical protein